MARPGTAGTAVSKCLLNALETAGPAVQLKRYTSPYL